MGLVGRNRFFAVLLASVLSAGNAWAGGWYLMVPPNRGELDPCCTDKAAGFCFTKFVATLTNSDKWMKSIRQSCDWEFLTIGTDAPFSQWEQGDAFETLAECQAERDKPMTEREKSLARFIASATAGSGVTEADTMSYLRV